MKNYNYYPVILTSVEETVEYLCVILCDLRGKNLLKPQTCRPAGREHKVRTKENKGFEFQKKTGTGYKPMPAILN